MGLKQKIRQKAKTRSMLHQECAEQCPAIGISGNYCRECGKKEWVEADVVDAVLNEAAKQIQEKAFCQKWSDNEPSPCPLKKLQKCLDTEKPCAKAVLLVSLKEVLSVLEGEKK